MVGQMNAQPRKILILGAAGRDFHDFQMIYRDDPNIRVVAFTATQIPGIADRRFPAQLAGPHYPDGIPIRPEEELEHICRTEAVDEVVFAYSDVEHAHVMHLASRALAAGASFTLPGPNRTMLEAKLPVIAITAVRTGAGKSPVTRWLARRLRDRGFKLAVLRHPMPYGQLQRQQVQRFASLDDLKAANCTVEEREEYEPHIEMGTTVFAGVDYATILRAAEAEAEILVWDGGNNDFPFIRPNLMITLADAMRPAQVCTHHPGEAVARMADILLINKIGSARPEDIAQLTARLQAVNLNAPIVQGDLPIALTESDAIKGKRVLVVEDGPTVTHGGMPHGAGFIAARGAGASEIIDPRPFAPAVLRNMYAAYPHLGPVLPAIGYRKEQLSALADTIAAAAPEMVVCATPIDLSALISVQCPIVRVRYEFMEDNTAALSPLIDAFLAGIPRS